MERRMKERAQVDAESGGGLRKAVEEGRYCETCDCPKPDMVITVRCVKGAC